MPTLDVFNDAAFEMSSLTAAVEILPFVPSRLGELGLFVDKPIITPTAMVENKNGVLQLFMTAARGTMPYTQKPPTRAIRTFRVPHIPVLDAVFADDVYGIRAFGTEDEFEAVQDLVNDKLESIRQNMELTWEWHRVGALKGEVLDADGTSVIYNYFTEFGVTQTEVDFDFTDTGTYGEPNPTQDMKMKALEVKRAMDAAMGGVSYKGIHAICGDVFYERLISHATVKDAFVKFQNGSPFLKQQQREVSGAYLGFEFGDITWENYRGAIGGTKFVDDDKAHFFPLGAGDTLIRALSPGDMVETVGTRGKPIYVKQERMKFDKGIELYGQSNPLHIPTRPAALILGVDTTGSMTLAMTSAVPDFEDPNDRAQYMALQKRLAKLQMSENPQKAIEEQMRALEQRADESPVKGVRPELKAEAKQLLSELDRLSKTEIRDEAHEKRVQMAIERAEKRLEQIKSESQSES